MKRVRNKYSYIVSLFFIFSCTQKYPSWYISTNKQHDVLIGVGSGSSFDNAVNRALADISGQIQSKVSASTNSVDNSNSYGLSYSTFGQQVAIKSSGIKIKNYEILNKAIIKNDSNYDEYIVQISAKKTDIISQEKIDLQILWSNVQNKIDTLLNYSLPEQRKKLKEIIEVSPTIIQKVQIIHSLDESFDIMNYVNKLEDCKTKLDNTIRKMSFYIDTANTDVKNIFATILRKENIRVLSKATNQKNTIIVQILPTFVESKFGNSFITNVNLEIILLNNNNEIVSNGTMSSSASSVISQEIATKNAIQNLSSEIMKNTVDTILGL